VASSVRYAYPNISRPKNFFFESLNAKAQTCTRTDKPLVAERHDGLERQGIDTSSDNAFIARFGLRLTGNLVRDKMVIKPFALVNLWHNFDGQDTIAFNQTSIATNQSVTAMEFGGGVSASVGKSVDVYAKATYTTDIDGNFQNSFTGKLGFRLSW
jgi:outer membrane autotransporter protein